jgi:hypothetical protein
MPDVDRVQREDPQRRGHARALWKVGLCQPGSTRREFGDASVSIGFRLRQRRALLARPDPVRQKAQKKNSDQS